MYGIRHVAEHRPERAWCVTEPAIDARTAAAATAPASAVTRPAWLLAAPQPLEASRGRPHHGALQLLRGPERIESGWWDCNDVQRDYYVAKNNTGALLWIYRECRGERRWFLHGIFG